MKIKNKIMLLIGIMVATLMYSTTSHAALQANGSTSKKDTIANWMLNIRKMEEAGGTLGLTDTINTTNLTSSAEKSNNLDIHMQLNTEYGAMAILSASSYGNQNKINSGETTTGNKSGVYINLNKEWVAAGTSGLGSKAIPLFGEANAKYKNIYTTTYVAKRGDAIEETKNWHGGSSFEWISHQSSAGLLRSIRTIFGYDGKVQNMGNDAAWDKLWYTRAVVVVGNGL